MTGALWLAAGLTAVALRGGHAISTGLDGAVRSWDNGASHVTASREYELYAVAAVGGHSAFCGNSRTVDVDGRTLNLPAGWCLALAFSPDGRTLAVGTSEKQSMLFDLASGKSTTLDTKSATAAIAWSSDGATVATGAFGVALWNATDGTLLRKLDAPPAAIHAVAFSPDGSRVAGAGRDKVVHIWNSATGELLRTIEPEGFAHFAGDKTYIEPARVPLLAVDFSPDGKTIATAGADRLVRLWDVDSGQELHRFEGHRASITALRFLPDGKHLVSASLDGTVHFWTID